MFSSSSITNGNVSLTPASSSSSSEDGLESSHNQQTTVCYHYRQFLSCLLPAEALKHYTCSSSGEEDQCHGVCGMGDFLLSSRSNPISGSSSSTTTTYKLRKRTSMMNSTSSSVVSASSNHGSVDTIRSSRRCSAASSAELVKFRSPSDFADWTEFHLNGHHSPPPTIMPRKQAANSCYYTPNVRKRFPKTLDGLQEIYFARWLHVNTYGTTTTATHTATESLLDQIYAANAVSSHRNYSRSLKKKQRGFALDELLRNVLPIQDSPSKLAQCFDTSPPPEESEADVASRRIDDGRSSAHNRLLASTQIKSSHQEFDTSSISDGFTKVLCHASAYLYPHVYSFGGLTAHGCPDDLWAFNIGEGLWRKVPVATPSSARSRIDGSDAHLHSEANSPITDDRPPPRYNHSLIGWRNKLVVFGGDRGPGYSDDLWIFDLNSYEWERVSLEVEQRGLRPGARAGHTACVYENSMIIYGGWRGSDGFSDVWAFQMVEREWLPLCPHISGDRLTGSGEDLEVVNEGLEFRSDGRRKMPLARHWHVAAVFGDYLYIHGGYGSPGVLKEVWRFNLKDKAHEWEHVPTFGKMPYARCRHAGTPIDNRRWAVLGGKDALGSYFNDFYILDIDSRLWQKIELFSPDPSLSWDTSHWWSSLEILQRFPALHCHTVSYSPESAVFVIVGGCDGDCNAKNNTILLKRSPIAILLFDEWIHGRCVQKEDIIATAISQCGEPYSSHILKFL